jgi:hypothetical protein
MAELTAAIASLDGDVEDEQGSFDWAMADEELHAGTAAGEPAVFDDDATGGNPC